MIKLYINSWPNDRYLPPASQDPESVKRLLTSTDVETDMFFDPTDEVDIAFLNAADDLLHAFCMRNVNVKIGLRKNIAYNYNYPGHLLIIVLENVRGSINPIVSKFFSWDRTETQEILTFDELMSDGI